MNAKRSTSTTAKATAKPELDTDPTPPEGTPRPVAVRDVAGNIVWVTATDRKPED